MVELFKIYDIEVSSLIFRAESNGSIYRIAESHLEYAGGQVDQGKEGVHHVSGWVVQTVGSTNVVLTDMIENGAAEDPLDTFEAQRYGIEGKDARDNMTFDICQCWGLIKQWWRIVFENI